MFNDISVVCDWDFVSCMCTTISFNFASRAFSLSVPSVWNSLKPNLRSIDSAASFKSQLKTTLFLSAYGSTPQHGSEPSSASWFDLFYRHKRFTNFYWIVLYYIMYLHCCLQNNASKLLLAIMESRHDSENAERILVSIQKFQLLVCPRILCRILLRNCCCLWLSIYRVVQKFRLP